MKTKHCSFSDQLKTSREKAGLTSASAAKLCGVSPRTWAYWEAGERLPATEKTAITRERVLAKLKHQGTP